MKFKNEKDKELFFSLHPILIMIYADMFYYAKINFDKELVITSTISTLSEDRALGRKSSAHRESRAIDIRTKNLGAFEIEELISFINGKDIYKPYHYVSSSGTNRLAYFHIGSFEHIHLSLHSKFKTK